MVFGRGLCNIIVDESDGSDFGIYFHFEDEIKGRIIIIRYMLWANLEQLSDNKVK